MGKFAKTKRMTNKLRVNNNFYGLVPGDILTLSDDGKAYVLESHNSVDSESGLSSTFDLLFCIGTQKAEELVKAKVLGEVEENKKKESQFVNVFDEIDKLLEEYKTEAEKLEHENDDRPHWFKVERSNVLESQVDLLMYLKSLKK